MLDIYYYILYFKLYFIKSIIYSTKHRFNGEVNKVQPAGTASSAVATSGPHSTIQSRLRSPTHSTRLRPTTGQRIFPALSCPPPLNLIGTPLLLTPTATPTSWRKLRTLPPARRKSRNRLRTGCSPHLLPPPALLNTASVHAVAVHDRSG